MDIQNQGRVETILPDFWFQGFWHFSFVDDVGPKLPYPQAWVYCNQWSQSSYRVFLLVVLVYTLATGMWCLEGDWRYIYMASY